MLENIFTNIRISSTDKEKIYNVLHPIKDYEACAKKQNTLLMRRKVNKLKTTKILKLAEKDIRTVISVFHMIKS